MDFLSTNVNVSSGYVGQIFITFGVLVATVVIAAISYGASGKRMPPATFTLVLVGIGAAIATVIAGATVAIIEGDEESRQDYANIDANLHQKYDFDSILEFSSGPGYQLEQRVKLLVDGQEIEYQLIQDKVSFEPFLTDGKHTEKPVSEIEKDD